MKKISFAFRFAILLLAAFWWSGASAFNEGVGSKGCLFSSSIITEVDGHAAAALSEQQVLKTNVTNVGQGANNVNITLPAAFEGASFTAQVGETSTGYWRFTDPSAAMWVDGVAGKTYAEFAAPTIGNYFRAFTFKSEPAYGLFGPPVLGVASTNTKVASAAFGYEIAYVNYSKAVVGAGTSLPAGTIPGNLWGSYLFSINAAGTIAVTPAAANAAGYLNESLAIAALPSLPASSADMGHVTAMNSNVTALAAVGSPSVIGWTDIITAPNGDVYATANGTPSLDGTGFTGTGIYKQAGGTGAFALVGGVDSAVNWLSIAAAPNGDIYAAGIGTYSPDFSTLSGSEIIKQPHGTSGFAPVAGVDGTQPWLDLAVAPNGDVYAVDLGFYAWISGLPVIAGSGVYMQPAGEVGFTKVDGFDDTASWGPIAAAPNGDVYVVNNGLYNAAYTAATGSGLWKKAAGASHFAQVGGVDSTLPWSLIAIAPNGDVYISENGFYTDSNFDAMVGGNIYKQAAGATGFTSLGVLVADSYGYNTFYALYAAPNGNVYAAPAGGYLWTLVNGKGSGMNAGIESASVGYNFQALTMSNSGVLYAASFTNDIFAQPAGGGFIAGATTLIVNTAAIDYYDTPAYTPVYNWIVQTGNGTVTTN